MSDIVVLTQVDEDGFVLDSLIIPLYDEEGNPNGILNSPYLVPPNGDGLWKPKWDFDNKVWTEGDKVAAFQATKDRLIERFNIECDNIIGDSFTYGDYEFHFRKTQDQIWLNMQLTFCLAYPSDELIEWKTKNAGPQYFTRDEFFNICVAGSKHLKGNLRTLWALEKYITDATTEDQLAMLTTFEESKPFAEELIKQYEEAAKQKALEGAGTDGDTTG
ncbi:tail fiber protein [Bacillus phage Moonbeam]|uniref:DUF4376 domain-containing protein n=1 Tax=Bacillus phage Moonbeam TaxID=1540091 RepID=A0A0A0RN45_9CAUD|nr:tail fiber protein [Bacillus phage Moonbeam]AIW03475.1 hypothetical protein CPT_Moonbeam77 [Bacillus phage Moonbeam]